MLQFYTDATGKPNTYRLGVVALRSCIIKLFVVHINLIRNSSDHGTSRSFVWFSVSLSAPHRINIIFYNNAFICIFCFSSDMVLFDLCIAKFLGWPVWGLWVNLSFETTSHLEQEVGTVCLSEPHSRSPYPSSRWLWTRGSFDEAWWRSHWQKTNESISEVGRRQWTLTL